MPMLSRRIFVSLALCAASSLAAAQAATDALPSWKDGAAKAAIVAFVQRVTRPGTPDFVPADERVATFDNDGTLWAEQPLYFQGLFTFDRIRAMAPEHPEWQTTEPFKSVLAGNMKGVMASGMTGLQKIIAATHAGMSADDFEASVRAWVATARHPTRNVPYTQLVYQPMLELLGYLRANDFKTYIVSGGGIDFMRVFAQAVYGIPPEQVVGSTGDAKFEMRNGVPTIVKTDKLVLLDDNVGKPVGIYRHIGRRPILAAGNSDGDKQMLEYTTIARNAQDTRPRLGLIVHHTDAQREWAYDRNSHIGKLDKALDDAPRRGWQVVDMRGDWLTVFPPAR